MLQFVQHDKYQRDLLPPVSEPVRTSGAVGTTKETRREGYSMDFQEAKRRRDMKMDA